MFVLHPKHPEEVQEQFLKPWINAFQAAHAFSTAQTEKLEIEITQLDLSSYYETENPHAVKRRTAEGNVSASACKARWVVQRLSFHRPFVAVFPPCQQLLRNAQQSSYFPFIFKVNMDINR